jgi:glutamate-1-semialdehyde 2,1-aminomutase
MSNIHTARSKEMLARARKVEALIDARPALFFGGVERIGGYPIFVDRASGPYLWDVDGNRYLDFVLGYGSVILGHAHPCVAQAVGEELLQRGGNPTLPSLKQVELAEKLVSLCPGVDLVTFLKTGSDATSAATRLARAVTGRKYILRWGMNGWHDWCSNASAGILEDIKAYTLSLRYNDLEYAESLFRVYGDNIACVILMPYELEAPRLGFLEGLRKLCSSYGALFILDEIRSGFRMSMGGAQAYFGIAADLVTYGKALANGYAISALAGRREYMKQILSIGLTVTYYRTPSAMAAGVATIEELGKSDGPQRLEKLGATLMTGLTQAAIRAGVPANSIGLPWTPFIKFGYSSEAHCERALRLFCNAMLSRGILLSPAHHWFVCTSMTDHDIATTIDAASDSFEEIRRLF